MVTPDSRELDDAAFEAELAASARRGRLLTVASAAVVVAVVAGGYLMLRPQLPPLDPEKLEDVQTALPDIKKHYPELMRTFAGKALQELEGERLPEPVLEALGDMGAVPPGMEGMVCGRAMTEPEVLEMFTQVCPDGANVLASAMQSGDQGSVVSGCGAEGQPFSAQDAAQGSAECVALGITIWGYLRSKNSEQEIERTLLRSMITGR